MSTSFRSIYFGPIIMAKSMSISRKGASRSRRLSMVRWKKVIYLIDYKTFPSKPLIGGRSKAGIFLRRVLNYFLRTLATFLLIKR